MAGKRESLLGQRFGRLVVRDFHEIRDKAAHWWCACDCTPTEWISVRATKLRMGRTVSCGCWRADPAVRQAARYKVPPERRKEIAALGGAARKNQ